MSLPGKLFLTVFAFLILFPIENSEARVNLALLGIGQFGSREFSTEEHPLRVNDRPKASYGGAVNLEIRFDHKWSFELGGTYVRRRSHVPTSITFGATQLDGGGNTVAADWGIATGAFRVWWEKFFFTFGGYYGFAVSDATIKTNLTGTTVTAVTAFENTLLHDDDYGLLSSVGWNFAGDWLRLEFRYLMGMRNATQVQDVVMKYRDFQLMLGIVF